MTATSAVVIGANGQLGCALMASAAAPADVIGLCHADIDVSDREGVASALEAIRPRWVLNTAALHDVAACERAPEEALRINAVGAWNVASACARVGARCLFVSTDYVFGSAAPRSELWTEDDRPMPVNVYGASKLAGEHMVLMVDASNIVTRISGLFGLHPVRGKPGSFVAKVLDRARHAQQVDVVADQWTTLTFAPDAAATMWSLIERDLRGVFHVANAGRASWFEVASFTLQQRRLEASVRPTALAGLQGPPRPVDSALDCARLRAFGLAPQFWQDAILTYLAATRPTLATSRSP